MWKWNLGQEQGALKQQGGTLGQEGAPPSYFSLGETLYHFQELHDSFSREAGNQGL